jgi:hypothetical protein
MGAIGAMFLFCDGSLQSRLLGQMLLGCKSLLIPIAVE